jgi:hypothetical protein
VSRRARPALVALVVTVALALAGCSSTGSGTAAVAPTSSTGSLRAPQGFAAVTLVVTLADGSVREWCVWLADTAELRQQGLMAVTDPDLGGAEAMVFAFPGDTTAAFWMKDTLLPLSIAWFRADGSFVSGADMDPCPAGVEECPMTGAGGRYRYAVEVGRGGLDRLGLVDGSSISLGPPCSPSTSAL